MPRTHYDNLQVSSAASDREIRTAFKTLAQQWHPDKNSHRIEEAEKNIKIINEAYRVLSNPTLRQDHDQWIQHLEDESRVRFTTNEWNHSNQRHPAPGQYPRRKKRSTATPRSFKVSKKRFKWALASALGIPAFIGLIIYNADKLPNLSLEKNASDSSGENLQDADINYQFESQLHELFKNTNNTLSLISDTDSAIAARSHLEESMSFAVTMANELDRADAKTRSRASTKARAGLNQLAPHIIRLQRDTRIWALLYPALNPMLNALRNIAG